MIKRLTPFFATAVFLSLSSSVSAQLVAGYSYLQGNYVEVGIGKCGVYGTDTMAVVGYHPNAAIAGIGFVADPERDGWGTSTLPTMYNYCGDYFVPGSPVEGWALTADGIDYINTDTYCATFDIPGSNVAYMSGADEDTSIWVGAVGGLTVTQTTLVPTNDVYFLTRMKIKNTSAATVTGVYYGRNVDPDNEQPWSGNFVTTHQIVSQPVPGVTIDAMVLSVGTAGNCYLGLGSQDPRASVNFGGFATIPADDLFFGTGRTNTLGASNTADEATGLGFSLGDLSPGDSVMFSFVYVLDTFDLDSAMLRTAPPCSVDPTVTLSGGTLTATGAADTYQWVNCDSGMKPIPGETAFTFSPTEDGNYACIITQGECTEVTPCTNVVLSATSNPEEQLFALSPNPVQDELTLTLPANASLVNVEVLNVAGQVVWKQIRTNTSSISADLSALQPGVYFVKVEADGKEQIQKLVKNK